MKLFPFFGAPEPITVLMPCKDQKAEYFNDAVRSLLRQDSPHWRILILTDPASPPSIAEWTAAFADRRITAVACPRAGFAPALNHGLALAESAFVSILLSDDRYASNAIRTLHKYRKRFPAADFFHSARRHIDSRGQYWGSIMPSKPRFKMEDFSTQGSPVKHLLCWRRELALSIGGMEEALSLHGCDDYDFPWRMAEAGARFQAVKECLYEYRLHHEHARLTTTVPLTRQISGLRAMFERHGVGVLDIDRYVQRAIDGYLIAEFTDQVDHPRGAQLFVRCFRESDALDDFLAAGFKQRNWFPHRVFCLPKGGPDGFKLARRMTGCRKPETMREFVLYAKSGVLDHFPREIFYDDNVQWHQQQFGLDGQIACANVVLEPGVLRCYLMISDLAQRVQRLPRFRSRISSRFRGWPELLLNAMLQYAVESDLSSVYLAASSLVLRNVGGRRNPQPELFERIYDRTPERLGAVREGDWWRLDVSQAAPGGAPLRRGFELDAAPKTVCIIHDIERGLGHASSDPQFVPQAEAESPEALRRMLEIEARKGVRVTYNVVGLLLPEIRESIETGGHTLAFHSFDHRISSDADAALEQFRQCRDLDYRLKGYRLPQSKLTPGLTEADFAEWNFEWMASSRYSLGTEIPVMEKGIVKIPVHADDYAMFREGLSYESWRTKIFELIDSRDFVVIGMHDCYAHLWLAHYAELLEEIQRRASLMTLNEVAARVTLGRARWFETTWFEKN